MHGSKGIGLTIRTIVLIAIGLVVLLATISLITGQDTRGMDCHAEAETVCLQYVRCGCCSSDCNKCSQTEGQITGTDNYPDSCPDIGTWSEQCC